MSIHYKFRNSLEYGTITFDNFLVSLKELRDAICRGRRMVNHIPYRNSQRSNQEKLMNMFKS